MELLYLEEVDSTNAYVKSHASELKDFTVVYTSHQTAGRGRLSRKWVDTGSDNVYMTIFLKPFDEFRPIYSNLTQYLSVILAQTLEDYGVEAKIKWPNDVLVNGKKIAGILSETSMQGSRFLGLALGIGINLNTSQESLDNIDKPATSLAVCLNQKIDRDKFLHALLEKFCLYYDKFINEGFLYIKDEYIKRASFLNTRVSINVLGEIHEGIAVGLTDDGALILNKNNKNHVFLIGDIL